MASHGYPYNNHNGYDNSAYDNSNHNVARPYYDYNTRDAMSIPTSPPYEGRGYSYNQPAHPLTQSYSHTGSTARLTDHADPFADASAIPLQDRTGKHPSNAVTSPVLPHELEDPFVRDAQPKKYRAGGGRGGKWFGGQITWVVYILTVAQVIVFVAEIIRNATLTKSPIEIHPSFNPMIGPSPYVLINMGARYQPCMHTMPNVQNATISISWPCPNATAITGASVSCSLSDLCGNGGVPNPKIGGSLDESPAPNQWWRFIVPIFLHAGIIHIGFNMLLQMTLGRDIEKLIGSIRFTIVYFASGIFGFVLGGNFAGTGIASCGCSGSLFGILALTLLDLLYTWKERRSPVKDLLFILLDVLIAFVLGLLPGLDNFSHIGGFLMGLVLGVCLLRSPSSFSLQPAREPTIRYSGISNRPLLPEREGLVAFARRPLSFFQNRRGIWWVWWLVRAAALVGVLIGFVLLLKNFYVWRTGCSWCKYLSCLPVKVGGVNWCDVGDLSFTKESARRRRSILQLLESVRV